MKYESGGEPSLKSFDEAARSFATLRKDRCDWCLSPFEKIYRSGLCRHCYRIKSDKQHLLAEVKRMLETGLAWRDLDLRLRIDCHVTGTMEGMARAEGQLD